MRIEHTSDSPILLQLIPDTPYDAFKNGLLSKSLSNMKIEHKVKEGDGTLLINIDPDGWKDFTEHGKEVL